MLGGYGGYTSGEIYLEKGTILYIYVGQSGEIGNNMGTEPYNGGGKGGNYTSVAYSGGGGGGATDIRYFASTPTSEQLVWNNAAGLNSRIMVAGGAGGAGSYNSLNGNGGGLFGYSLSNNPGTQTTGIAFGAGGNSISPVFNGGGGGGYYGGYYGPSGGYGSGGSSYISGHSGCSSIMSLSNRTHTGSSLHFTELFFTNTKMIDGAGYSWASTKESLEYMPNPNGGSYPSGKGNTGNGYARITFLNYTQKTSTEIATEKINIQKNKFYPYNGLTQTFTAPQTGTYKIEAWGAQGGRALAASQYTDVGGYGGYTSGEIYLEKGTILYIYVGQSGEIGNNMGTEPYNGGGKGGNYTSAAYSGGGGGGATDIRYFASTPTSEQLVWNNAVGLNSRIMVAGGAGGAGSYNSLNGNGGGLVGYNQSNDAGTQINGFAFGLGGSSISPVFNGGGGGGYYGGYYGTSGGYGSGGSSYISGHAGCIAINNLSESSSPRTILSGCTSTSTSLACSYHISGKKFTNTFMIDGAGYQWTTTKGSLVQITNPYGGTYASGKGNTGDGFARITLIS